MRLVLTMVALAGPGLPTLSIPAEFRPLFELGRTWSYHYRLEGSMQRGQRGYGPVKHEEIESCSVTEIQKFPSAIASRVACAGVRYLRAGEPAYEVYRGMAAVYVFNERGLWRHAHGMSRLPKNDEQLRRSVRGERYLAIPLVRRINADPPAVERLKTGIWRHGRAAREGCWAFAAAFRGR